MQVFAQTSGRMPAQVGRRKEALGAARHGERNAMRVCIERAPGVARVSSIA